MSTIDFSNVKSITLDGVNVQSVSKMVSGSLVQIWPLGDIVDTNRYYFIDCTTDDGDNFNIVDKETNYYTTANNNETVFTLFVE
jgi:hypothetical protein